MSAIQPPVTFERAWFDLDAQRKPVNPEQFLAGAEAIEHAPHIAGSDYAQVADVLQQLNTAEVSSAPQAERVNQAAQRLFKEWPTVKIGDQALHIPSSTLCKISPKFQALLSAGMLEAQQNCIDLEPPENEALVGPLLNYLATEDILINCRNAMDLLRFSCQHKIEALTGKCAAFIGKKLTWDVFDDVLDVAIEENLPWLIFHCLSFAQKNWMKMLPSAWLPPR